MLLLLRRLLLLLSRRRPVLDLEPGLIENQVLEVAPDGHIASTRAQLPPQLLLNKKLDDVLLLLLAELLLLEVVRGIGSWARTTVVVDVVADHLLLLTMDSRDMTVA